MNDIAENKRACLADPRRQMRDELFGIYGPVIGGSDLVRALGYSNAAAFRQARRQGRVGLNIFNLPARRGSFALSADVADWLIAASRTKEEKAMP